MDLSSAAEQAAVRQLAAEFVDREIVPHAAAWDRRESVDRGDRRASSASSASSG